MAQSTAGGGSGYGGYRGGRVVGDYIFGRQIGSGSFSVVWHARHRVHGTEVAVKEIAMERLGKKLQESLLSEINILRRINHPNIIALYDIIRAPRRMYLILEYCRGGDLSMYISCHGKVSEATAKHFMQQLATGLQVLRENNLIHRDLKPQNLLLLTNDENSILKIADFGFARSLQPCGLAETLCGSPLYMAPEIMQLQKYDAKADLWSVGAILFQLVTGKTPFTGNNQIQLLQNIVKSNELHFPPDNNLSYDCIDLCQKLLRRNPVERLTFEEFFNHHFLSRNPSEESLSQTSAMRKEGFPSAEYSPARNSGESLQEDCLPFPLDDESSGHDLSPSTPMNKVSMRSTYGISADNRIDEIPACSPSRNADMPSRYSSAYKQETSSSRCDPQSPLDANMREPKLPALACRDPIDPLELDDQDYVIVSGPPLEMSFLSGSAFQMSDSRGKSDIPLAASPKISMLSAPMPITGIAIYNTHPVGSLESHGSPASGASQGSTDMGDATEQPLADRLTRIRSLQRCASIVTELVKDKNKNGRRLEAFSVQLVVLAIWKQALHMCHAQAASALEGTPSPEGRNQEIDEKNAVCSQIEREFLVEVGHAEELARDLGQIDEATKMPDAMEVIFQSALILGRQGGAVETMEELERASILYSKAVDLLYFLLVEAPSLTLNPPFTLTNTDRYRLRSYIDILNNRQNQSRSQRMALFKSEDL